MISYYIMLQAREREGGHRDRRSRHNKIIKTNKQKNVKALLVARAYPPCPASLCPGQVSQASHCLAHRGRVRLEGTYICCTDKFPPPACSRKRHNPEPIGQDLLYVRTRTYNIIFVSSSSTRTRFYTRARTTFWTNRPPTRRCHPFSPLAHASLQYICKG